MTSLCALCGQGGNDTRIVRGVNGFVCLPCLGDAFAAAAKHVGNPMYADEVDTGLDANKRCLICGNSITAGNLVAHRGPYCFCGACLMTLFEDCIEGEAGKLQAVEF